MLYEVITLTFPVVGTFKRWDTKKFKPHLIYTIALSILWLFTIILPITGNDIHGLWLIFLLGAVGYTWVAGLSINNLGDVVLNSFNEFCTGDQQQTCDA